MNKITEVEVGRDATPWLICPLMSGQVGPVPGLSGGVVTPHQTMLAPNVVTCAREKCQWYDQSADECAIWTIAQALFKLAASIPQIAAGLEPPIGGSPLMRIADSLEKLVEYQTIPRKG